MTKAMTVVDNHHVGTTYVLYIDKKSYKKYFNELKEAMMNIMLNINTIKRGIVITPNVVSLAYDKMYNKQEDNPYYYNDEMSIFGFCIEYNSLSPSQVKRVVDKEIKKNNFNFDISFSYDNFDTFWISYSKDKISFMNCINNFSKHIRK